MALHELSPAGRPRPAGPNGDTYYGLPALKPSHYGQRTAASFFSEATAGAAQLLATLGDLLGGEELRPMVRAGRYLALSGALAAPALLVSDLHTPNRWYNMLRIFRKTSPMSIGSWFLCAFGALTGVAAGGQLLEDLGARRLGRALGRLFGAPAAVAGGVVALYMGTELEETATPLWSSAYPALSPLFAARAVSSAAAALGLASRAPGAASAGRQLDAVGALAGVAELAAAREAEVRWLASPGGGAYREPGSRNAFLAYLGLGVAIPLGVRAVQALTGRRSPAASALASAASLAGGYLLPALVVEGGKRSGRRGADYLEASRPEAVAAGRRETAGIGGAAWVGSLAVGAAALTLFLGRRRPG